MSPYRPNPERVYVNGSLRESSLVLHVSVHAGTTIEWAARDLIELANKLDVLVTADFNGFRLRAYPGGEWRSIEGDYLRGLIDNIDAGFAGMGDYVIRKPPKRWWHFRRTA